MSTHPIHTVDVFAQGQYTGNQLAVIRDASNLTADEMQSIALEMNYSETTFIRGTEPTDDGYRVRIFTPTTELPFAGHPTLGSAYIIREHIAENDPDEIVLDLDIGPIPVTIEQTKEGEEIYWMKQIPPELGEIIDGTQAADIVSLNVTQLASDYPNQVVYTGLPTLIIPVNTLDDVREARLNRDAYSSFIQDRDANAVLIFASEAEDDGNDIHDRMFAPAGGVPEDPATGSSNGALAGYLSHYEYFGTPDIDITVEQGYEINRPSLLYLQTQGGDEIDIAVGGRVSPVLDGELL